MAKLNCENLTFENIRLIICTEGYHINYEFVPREIGFWSRNQFGVIPFSCRINCDKLKPLDKNKYKLVVTNRHGISCDKLVENSLTKSEMKAVLKSLYHSTYFNESAKYIGVSRYSDAINLLYLAGLGDYVVELENMPNFFKDGLAFPSLIESNQENDLHICSLHDNLTTGRKPVCAGVVAKLLGDIGINMKTVK
jgi:hypothetical protein